MRALFAGCSLLSAFLLFSAQPMLAKWLLPGFGGSPATFLACMVFFQGVLLLGYLYVHGTTRLLAPRTQALLHFALLACAALTALCTEELVSFDPGPAPRTPVFRIASVLAVRVGVAYLALSATAPLVQRWAALHSPRSPFVLYAFSNAGSLLGLLAYPALVEPWLALDAQWSAWSAGLLVFCLSMTLAGAGSGALLHPGVPAPPRASGTTSAPAIHRGLYWFASACVPSALLLATTQHLTTDVAATPLLWVVPLSLYSLSFVLAFSAYGAGLRSATLVVWALATAVTAWTGFSPATFPLFGQLVSALFALFSSALLCHAELARARPDPHELTGYYTLIAFGGVFGAVLVSWIAPLVFRDYYELELSLLGTASLLIACAYRRGAGSWPRRDLRVLLLGVGLCVPLLASSALVRLRDHTPRGLVLVRQRDFLGSLRVTQLPEAKVLTHGRIKHGMQLRDPERSMQPTLYYGPGTALARVLTAHARERPRRIGVLGLGAGTVAAFARAEDTLRFYELDPKVARVARQEFSFLQGSAAKIRIELGDGRLLLSRERDNAFDVLVVDVFSSDAVPVHLLTREAFALYARHLASDGVLVVNVSNRHLALDRVVRAGARAVGLACRVVSTPAEVSRFQASAKYAVLARSEARLDALLFELPQARGGALVTWTDAHASLLSILR